MSIRFAIQDWLSSRFNYRLGQTLLRLIRPSPIDRLLDLGGGTGFLADSLSASYEETCVLEPNPTKVKFGARKRRSIGFVVGVGEVLPFHDQYFQTVLAIASFHHFRDQDLALDELSRVTAHRGKLAIVELDPKTSVGKLARIIENLSSAAKPQFNEPAQLKEKVSQHGFHNVSTVTFSRAYILTATKP